MLKDVENAVFCVFVDFEITGSQKIIGSILILSMQTIKELQHQVVAFFCFGTNKITNVLGLILSAI